MNSAALIPMNEIIMAKFLLERFGASAVAASSLILLVILTLCCVDNTNTIPLTRERTPQSLSVVFAVESPRIWFGCKLSRPYLATAASSVRSW